uniref:AlNc14C41G3501 protein n=1 Tax=Albugo laibachii Nc14 TaxID=890382 RepID=F0W9P6_9STRA|nr:AlNc14C41G3501 [Albugo laibachii Nc14]|eukprot:CCA17864.1 AlNc14C41G3501 [Albugo laibachii Nc14]
MDGIYKVKERYERLKISAKPWFIVACILYSWVRLGDAQCSGSRLNVSPRDDEVIELFHCKCIWAMKDAECELLEIAIL